MPEAESERVPGPVPLSTRPHCSPGVSEEPQFVDTLYPVAMTLSGEADAEPGFVREEAGRSPESARLGAESVGSTMASGAPEPMH
jgi:hypothetical protein